MSTLKDPSGIPLLFFARREVESLSAFDEDTLDLFWDHVYCNLPTIIVGYGDFEISNECEKCGTYTQVWVPPEEIEVNLDYYDLEIVDTLRENDPVSYALSRLEGQEHLAYNSAQAKV